MNHGKRNQKKIRNETGVNGFGLYHQRECASDMIFLCGASLALICLNGSAPCKHTF